MNCVFSLCSVTAVDPNRFLATMKSMNPIKPEDPMDPVSVVDAKHHVNLEPMGQGWTGKLFFSWGGAGRGKAKNLWGGARNVK